MMTGNQLNALPGRATGVLFFTAFGSFWLALSLAAWGRLDLKAGAAIALLAALLVAGALHLAKSATTVAARCDALIEDEGRANRRFIAVNAVQWIAIAAVLVLANVFGKQAYIAPAIAAVVGLHLLPLASLFRHRAHYVTGTLLVAAALAVSVAAPAAAVPALSELCSATILLTAAACTLLNGLITLRAAKTLA